MTAIVRGIRARYGGWGISAVLAAVLVVTLAPFVGLEAYRGALDVQRRHDAVEQQARAQALEAADVTGEFLGFSQRFIASLAGTPPVQSLDPAGSRALFDSVRRQSQNYATVFLLNTDGGMVASSGSALQGPRIAERRYFQEALYGSSMTISDVLAVPDSGRSVLVLAYPVIDAGGERAGVMGIELNIARLSDVVGSVRLPAGSILLLAQEDGTIIAANTSLENWVGRRITGLPPFTAERPPTEAGITAGLMSDGVRRVVAYEPVKGAPWMMLAGVPQSEVNTALGQSIVRVSEEVALAALATVVLGWIMLRRVVIPIRILSDGARAFAAGFLDRRIGLHRRDELGSLAEALNSMAATLQQRLEKEAAAAEALRSLNQLQTEFVATASHELRTPVTAIRSYAEALLRPDIGDEETRRECLDGIDRSSRRLAELVRTLLDVSRIDSGQVPMQLAPVDVAQAARVAVEQAAPHGGDGVTVHAPPGLPAVEADAGRLEDTLANLIGNAIKFSPPAAPVVVELSRQGAEVVIAVRDRGIGITAEELPRIFDRFYQVGRGTGRQAGGSGLGLYIVRAYVNAMGGRLWAESEPGQGSSFFVALPVANETAAWSRVDGNDAERVSAPARR